MAEATEPSQSGTIDDAVAEMELFDGEGSAVKFGGLYNEKKALIVFVRHFL
eukprot:m.13644 g.13644  ORF g.13644 m.13644 type:complete len:51 (+) comp25141_c0_seq1:448-600(+)